MMMMPTHRAIPTADKDFVFLNLAKDMEAWKGSFKDMEACFTSGCTKMLNTQSKLTSWEWTPNLILTYLKVCATDELPGT